MLEKEGGMWEGPSVVWRGLTEKSRENRCKIDEEKNRVNIEMKLI